LLFFFLGRHNFKTISFANNSAEFQTVISKIKTSITSIESAQTTSSKDIIIENTLPLIKKAYSLSVNNKEVSSLKSSLNALYYKTNDIVPVSNITVLSDVGILYPGSSISSAASLNGYLYLTDPIAQYVFKLSESNVSTPQVLESLKTGTEIPQSIAYSRYSQTMFLYDTNKGLLTIGTDGAINEQAPPVSSQISDVATYGGSLYLLAPKTGAIYLGSNTSFNISKVFSSPLLKGAKSIAVDGNIFAIGVNGNIIRFYNNTVTPFSISNIPAMQYPLIHPSSIYDTQYTNHIYVLDPRHQRIVVLQKPTIGATNTIDYTFVKQYVYTGNQNIFKNATYMTLSANQQEAYIIEGSKIIKMNI
jgi:hypothetical protein